MDDDSRLPQDPTSRRGQLAAREAITAAVNDDHHGANAVLTRVLDEEPVEVVGVFTAFLLGTISGIANDVEEAFGYALRDHLHEVFLRIETE